jgi:hypothetical protein
MDCTHWEWENCPTALKGQYRDREGNTSTILEAIASQDGWIWHAFFGMPGSCNDLNVLDNSPFLVNMMEGGFPASPFTVNSEQFTTPYFLVDGIYPSWSCFIKGLSQPLTEEEKIFTEKVASCRQDIERTFGMLKKRWLAFKRPARWWHSDHLADILRAMIIMHNMIVEDERSMETFEERLYFLSDAEREEFLAQMQNVQVVEPVDEATILSTALESAGNNLQNICNIADHRLLTSNLIRHVADHYRK